MTLYEHELKNAYIGEYTEWNFSISQITSSSSTSAESEVKIWKSGFRITKIIIETSAQCQSNYYWNFNVYLNSDSRATPLNYYRFAIGTGRNDYCRIEYWTMGWTQTNWQNLSWRNSTNNTVVYTIEATWANSTINSSDTTWSYTSSEETFVQSILESEDAYVVLQVTQGSAWPATITVLYDRV